MEQADGRDETRRKILVVDDDPETARLLTSWFRGQPYDITAAPDGREGLRVALGILPDLIVLDLRMPELDGISAARELKSDPSTRSIPVLMLTACRDVDDKVEAFAAGADDYVTKPFEFEEIAARIEAMLRKREIVVSLQDRVRNLAATNDQLEKLLMIDDKTGLFNFREFQRRLHDEWERATRYETNLSLVFLDLDFFKRVNDTLGHQAGDQVLEEFATLVAGGARANDISARYGGEEFAVILPHTDRAMAVRVAERILAAVREFDFLSDTNPTRITVSAGVATYPSTDDIDSVDALVRAADTALYAAKDGGRDRVCPHGESRKKKPRLRVRPANVSDPRHPDA
jgi:diguanylate cyclase (GGDEF)-like protein